MSIVQEKMYMDSLLRRWFQAAVLHWTLPCTPKSSKTGMK